jgi:RNA polymerase sigma-70 factor (ECF subfamily)
MMAVPSDEQLLAALLEDDENALRVLVDRYASSIYRFALRFCNDQTLAEDISQEVFLRVYRYARQFHPGRVFKAWLFAIARNVSIDLARAARVRRFESLDESDIENQGPRRQALLPVAESTVQDRYIQQETEQALRRALHDLPENQRSSIILRYYEGMAVKDIAVVMDCSVSAVESLLIRAKRNLAKSMEL